ncbi:MAG: MFS transporter [Proteobacteria bacterium]|nr:MFS transporter [Pseudomonadota bacterium]MBU1585389.1 MFS transporter [Pseudomonadota bacterium]MBU2453367.1 MFS transporter [Pseudomonadota bacterium]MBU2630663.1 MFS transporter [Pseudomonadota bacterium]
MPLFSLSAFRVFIPFAFGYFLSYLFRVVNAVIAPDLVADLQIDPSQLGLLTSTYFIAFASSQLPLGIFLDRFGPRIVEAFLLFFAGLGAFIFAKSQTLTGVIIGRAFIGFGVSACLMAAFKSYVIWFPEKLWPRINGFQMAAGGLGALFATTPVEWVLKLTDWRGLFLLLALMSCCIALGVFFLVPENKAEKYRPLENFSEQVNGIKQVFTSQNFWRIAPLTTLSQAGYLSLQGLWAGPWLRDIAGMQRPQIATVLSCSAIAMIAGYIFLGFFAEKLAQKGVTTLFTAVCGMGIFIGVQALIAFQVPLNPTLLWILFGFFGTSGILSYAALTYHFPKTLSGRVTTGINLLVFIAAFIVQWAIGAIINLWETSAAGNYHPSGYKAGFLTILCLQAAGLVWCLFSSFKNR